MTKLNTLARSIALIVALPVVVSSCAFTEDDGGAVYDAKRVRELREKAENCLKDFIADADTEDGADLSDLECYVDAHRETTKIYPSPSDCPICYAQYGNGLRMLGGYYRTLSLKQERQAKRVSGSQRDELIRLSKENEKKAQRHYRESLSQFNLHLRSAGPIDTSVYWRGFEVAARLERYKIALEYLKAYEKNSRLDDEQQKEVDQWRDWAEKQWNRRVRAEVRRELDE